MQTVYQVWFERRPSQSYSEWVETDEGRAVIAARSITPEIGPGAKWTASSPPLEASARSVDPLEAPGPPAALSARAAEFIRTEDPPESTWPDPDGVVDPADPAARL